MDEVFDLKSRNQWLRRRIVAILQQIAKTMFGDSINRSDTFLFIVTAVLRSFFLLYSYRFFFLYFLILMSSNFDHFVIITNKFMLLIIETGYQCFETVHWGKERQGI